MATQADRTPLLPLTPPSATHQTSVILCDFGGVSLTQRTRRSGAGRTTMRMTLDIKATPLLANLNGVELGRAPSEAIRKILIEQSAAIQAPAKPSTILKRKYAATAYDNGKGWAMARYSGGRTAARRPGAFDTIGNDSGRLANGWFVTQNPKEGSWTVNTPANRFDLTTWGGDASSLQAWIARFVSLVPALRDPRTILRDPRFVKALSESPPVVKLTRTNAQAIRDWARAAASAIGQADSLANRLGAR